MTDDATFRRAILARPLDPLPRLIYADFLDEHGRCPEATWLRADVRAFQAAPDPDPEDTRLLQETCGPDGVPSLWLAQMLLSVPWAAASLFVGLGQSLLAAFRSLARVPTRDGP